MGEVPGHGRKSIIVFLGVVAVVMALTSILLPWYRVDLEQVLTSGEEPTPSSLVVYLTYLKADGPEALDLCVDYSSFDQLPSGTPGTAGLVDDVAWVLLMVMAASVLTGLLFIGQVLTDRGGLIAGWAAVALGVFAVAYTAVSLPDGLSGLEYLLGTHWFPIDGFTGTTWSVGIDAPPWREDWSWGPSSGWYMALSSTVLMTVVVLHRTMHLLRSLDQGKRWIGVL